MRIYKYALGRNYISEITMPRNAKILKVDSQFDEGFIWALINDYSETEVRTFGIYNTGDDISPNIISNYLGTYMTHAGNYVHHVFEIGFKPG